MRKYTMEFFRNKWAQVSLVVLTVVAAFLIRTPIGIYGRRTIEMEYISAMLGFRDLGVLHPYSIGLEMALHIPPLYSWVTYPLLLLTQEFWIVRVVAASFGLGTLFLVYVVARRLDYSEREAGLAVFLLAVTPLFLSLSFGVMEDTLMMFLLSLTFLVFLLYVETGAFRYLAATSVLASIAILSNYQSVFVMIVPGIYLLKEHRFSVIYRVKESAIMLLPVLTGLGWHHHIESLSSGSATSELLMQTILELPLDPVVLVKAFGPDLAAIIPLTLLVPVALYTLDTEEHFLEFLWFGALALFLVVFLERLMGNIQYWGIIFPPAALLSGKVFGQAIDRFAAYRRPLITGILVAGVLWSAFFVSIRIPLEQEQEFAAEIEDAGTQLGAIYIEGDSVTAQVNIREVVFYSWIPITAVDSTPLFTAGQVDDPGTDLLIMTDQERRLPSAVDRFKAKYLGQPFDIHGEAVQPPANYERVGGTEHIGIYRRMGGDSITDAETTLNGAVSPVS